MANTVKIFTYIDDDGHICNFNIDKDKKEIYEALTEMEQSSGILSEHDIEFPFDHEDMDTPTFEGILQEICQRGGPDITTLDI